nr:sodium channel protein Nach-like [Nomia melanderi]
MEFCRDTGLHGYKYIGESHRAMKDRIVWAIMAFVSLCTAIVIIVFTYDYYANHRVSSVIKSTHYGIWNYPFPAVTVCNINRVSLRLTRKLVDKLNLPPSISKELVVQDMKLLNELLYPGQTEQNIRYNLSRLQYIFDANGLSIPTVIESVTQSCESLLTACKLKNYDVQCNQLFTPRYSRDGLCCSFNYISREQFLENKTKPLKVTSCGYQNGLSLLISFEPDDYHASFLGSIGIKVMVHYSYDYPDFDASTKLVIIEKYSFLTVYPKQTYSTEHVRELENTKRDCIFADEGDKVTTMDNQGLFARYSYQNCLVECRANVIKAKCGCIPYYYPQNETRVCDLRDIECLEVYKSWYASSWPGRDLSPKTLRSMQIDVKDRPCNCKPDCDFYRYVVESSEGTLNKRIFHVGLKYSTSFGENNTWKNQSVIHVFFDDLVSVQFRQDVHYSWRHIFATFGGLLGLFAGFSLMSIFEFIYFFVIRVMTNTCSEKHDVDRILITKNQRSKNQMTE